MIWQTLERAAGAGQMSLETRPAAGATDATLNEFASASIPKMLVYRYSDVYLVSGAGGEQLSEQWRIVKGKCIVFDESMLFTSVDSEK